MRQDASEEDGKDQYEQVPPGVRYGGRAESVVAPREGETGTPAAVSDEHGGLPLGQQERDERGDAADRGDSARRRPGDDAGGGGGDSDAQAP